MTTKGHTVEYKDGLDLLLREVRRTAGAVFAFEVELQKESDRGCALVSAAYLEEELSTLLRAFFVKAGNARLKQLFDFNGPLGTFSSKIQLAFALGLIATETRTALDLVRKIRNGFAHLQEPMDFEDTSIEQRILALLPGVGIDNQSPRETFIDKVQSLFATLQTRIVATQHRIIPSQEIVSIGDTLEEYELELAARQVMKLSGDQLTYDEAVEFAKEMKGIK